MFIYLFISIIIQPLFTAQLNGFIRPSYNSTEDLRNVKININGDLEARVDKTGFFIFPKIPLGKFELKVLSVDYIYPSFEIENDENGIQVFWVDKKDGGYAPASLPLQITELSKNQFFELKEPINIASYLKSPYGIMILVTLALILCMKNMPSAEEMQGAAQVQK